MSEWSSWSDQKKYLQAAAAWGRLDLSASEHWYPPGYPILGALGRFLTPTQPFYVPDALLLAASAWLSMLLASELLGRRPGGRALGAGVFAATTALNAKGLEVWGIPWTTTAATPLTYACLLLAMRLTARPCPRTCLLVGLSGGAIALFRPTDAALVLSCAGLAMAWSLLRHPPSAARFGRVALAGLAGTAAPAALFLAGMYATGGFGPKGYFALSGRFGFEWRLIPLHWIGIVGDPRPFWPGEHGLQAAFPWVVPGVAGIAAVAACCSPARRPGHVLLAGSVALHFATLLAYRDIEPSQLWWYHLYHYFKWTVPVLGLYSVLLLPALVRRPAIALPAALAACLLLFPWRIELEKLPGDVCPAIRLDERSLRLPQGLPSLQDAVLVPATGDVIPVFQGEHRLHAAGREWRAPFDLHAYPRPGGFLILPRRPLPAADTTIRFGPGITLDPAVAPIAARQRVAWGVPCWLAGWRRVCNPGPRLPGPVLPGPVLPPGQAVDFRTEGGEYRMEGWSIPDPTGTWTVGPDAGLSFRAPEPGPHGVVVEMTGQGFVPHDGPPSPIDAFANGAWLTTLQPPGQMSRMRLVLPASLFGPDGRMWLRLRVRDPIWPASQGGSDDSRPLGLLVQSLRLVPGGSGPNRFAIPTDPMLLYCAPPC